MAWLIHSAKGSSWKSHLYVKRDGAAGRLEEDGKYYYPDSYKGGRHLPKNGKDNRATGEKKYKNDYPDDMEEWEKKVHDHLSGIIEKHPDLFKTGTDVAKGIMDPNNFQAVKNTLKAFGLPVEKMSDDDIKKLRRKIADAYDDKYQPEEPKVSSKKKKKAKSTTEDNKTDEKSSNSKKKSGSSETSRVTMAKNEASKRSKEGMAKKDSERITHSGFYISHSAKGTTWKKHKYIKKVGNRYYYKDTDVERQWESSDLRDAALLKKYGPNSKEAKDAGVWANSSYNEAITNLAADRKEESRRDNEESLAAKAEYTFWNATIPAQKVIKKGKNFISRIINSASERKRVSKNIKNALTFKK